MGNGLSSRYELTEVYNASNFADKFNFVNLPDRNDGYVYYQRKEEAMSQGLYAIRDNEVYIGVDHSTDLTQSGLPGRASLRLESKSRYKYGLIVARFTHLPALRCGTWPAFWTVGDSWPAGGEIDLFEGFNEDGLNRPAFHVGGSDRLGACRLDGAGQSSQVSTANCDNKFQDPPLQWPGQGCTSADPRGLRAYSNGGTYALEWAGSHIKLYNFERGREPADLASPTPDTATWGTPSVFLKAPHCDIDSHFQAQRLVLDIAFCGNPTGTALWDSCWERTNHSTCADYVAGSPADFAETYFQIQDIRVFTMQRILHPERVSGGGGGRDAAWPPTRKRPGETEHRDVLNATLGFRPAGYSPMKNGSMRFGVSAFALFLVFALMLGA
ncbi:putative endo-1 [Escovopsis weberi]|uniref:Putative endo-1 n=1 Tax=Escovopsis weberi TaxID=150374 RepID=A0A0M8MWK5_ESCWE|nr:putative endo-1 [Escovopsis weberi]